MDVSAILDESLGALSRPLPAKAAQFILVLSLIDRTVLPRQIALLAKEGSLVLLAAERRAQLANGEPLSARDLVARIAGFCRTAASLRHKVRAARAAPLGFSVAELVNAQDWGASGAFGLETGAEVFSFDDHGWPAKMPEEADVKSMVSAWLLHLWMQGWLKRRAGAFGERVFVATTAGNNAREFAFHLSPEKTDIITVEPRDLGRLLAAWRIMTAPPQHAKASQPSEG
jgi:hypothetical protein